MSGNARNLPRELFIWKYEHDVCLIREVLLVEPFVHKPQSKERGQAWRTITANLNALEQPVFKVAIRAVRDRLFKLLEKYRKNEREEARASGIQGAEVDELYMGLADIDERMTEAQKSWNETNRKAIEKENQEKEMALEMRRKATENLSETKKRKGAEGEIVIPKRQRKSAEVLAVMQEGITLKREMAERDANLREQELQERKLERESHERMAIENQEFLKNMQREQQQFMLAMQQSNMQFLGQIAELFQNAKNN